MKAVFFLLVIVWLLSGLAMVHLGGYYIFGVFFLAFLFFPALTWARDRGDPRDRDDRTYLPAGYTSIQNIAVQVSEPPRDITRKDFILIGSLAFLGLPTLFGTIFGVVHQNQNLSFTDSLFLDGLIGASVGLLIGFLIFFCVTTGVSLDRTGKHSAWEAERRNAEWRRRRRQTNNAIYQLPQSDSPILAVDGPSAPELDVKEETADELRMKALIEGWKKK